MSHPSDCVLLRHSDGCDPEGKREENMPKIQNPMQVASFRILKQFREASNKLYFTDVTAIEENINESCAEFLNNPDYKLLAFINDVSGNKTFLTSKEDKSVVILWDEIESGKKAVVTVSANSLESLTESFTSFCDVKAVNNVRPVGHDEF